MTRNGEYGLCTHLHLGRPLFQSDRPELLQSVNEYYARLQQEEGFTTIKKEATMEKR